jgi:alkylation response protein AidB-like acyl-CoA dehydrogenase
VFVVERAGRLVLVPAAAATLRAVRSVDAVRDLAEIDFASDDPRTLVLGSSAEATRWGILASAAFLLGLTESMLDRAVEYAGMRTQFGKAIGTFQAVQHRLADARVALEFARPPVYRAAWSLDCGASALDVHLAMAKVMASEAAETVAKAALQVHGAIGYSTELDLHLYMKRAWALARAHGSASDHRQFLIQRIVHGAQP